MSRAAKLTAMERTMLPPRVVSRIVKADHKLQARRRAAMRKATIREELKKSEAAIIELCQAIIARNSQPRVHTIVHKAPMHQETCGLAKTRRDRQRG
ncbi:hypothetical protein ACHAPV_008969 [Trichoderma viride]